MAAEVMAEECVRLRSLREQPLDPLVQNLAMRERVADGQVLDPADPERSAVVGDLGEVECIEPLLDPVRVVADSQGHRSDRPGRGAGHLVPFRVAGLRRGLERPGEAQCLDPAAREDSVRLHGQAASSCRRTN